MTFLTVLEKGTGSAKNLEKGVTFFPVATSICICWVDVKYIDAKSSWTFSVIGIQPSSLTASVPGATPFGWPFLIIDIGSPFSPEFDQLFFILPATLDVLPNLIELPNLPSIIVSPS